VLHQQESRRKLVRAASPATATTSTSADRQRQRPPLHQQRQRPLLRAAYQRWRSPQGVRHRKEVLAPVLMRGATTRPLKPKSRGLGGRGALMVPLAEATTSAVGSLTSSGNHLSTNDSDHLCTGRQRLPQHARRGPRSRPLTGVTTRPSKNAAATPAAYDVLYDPPPPVRPTGRRPRGCGGPAHDATVTRAVDGHPRPGQSGRRQRRRRRRSHPAQRARHAAADSLQPAGPA
jgi:hypothetical protein